MYNLWSINPSSFADETAEKPAAWDDVPSSFEAPKQRAPKRGTDKIMTSFSNLSEKEQSIYLRIDRLLRDMKKAGLCIFINDGTFEVYRGVTPPHTRFDGSVDNTKSIMEFQKEEYCCCDGGATL